MLLGCICFYFSELVFMLFLMPNFILKIIQASKQNIIKSTPIRKSISLMLNTFSLQVAGIISAAIVLIAIVALGKLLEPLQKVFYYCISCYHTNKRHQVHKCNVHILIICLINKTFFSTFPSSSSDASRLTYKYVHCEYLS